MRFEKFIPSDPLKPYIRYFAVSETESEGEYKVLPSTGLVVGFQYKGKLATIEDGKESALAAAAGISGIADRFKIFKNAAGTGTVLVYFTETGFTHFATHPAHELFDLSLSLDHIFDKSKVAEVSEKLMLATSDTQRIQITERFLLSQLKELQRDKLVVEAVKLIYQTNGTIRMKELSDKLFTSQSPFEKRFRKLVGTTPKKFSAIVRFNGLLDHLQEARSLTEICYEYHFFDQAHFIRNFKQFTGEKPEQFRRLM